MNILFLTPHLSTGGMPEFLRLRVQSLYGKNKIIVVEYRNVSDEYTVQKKQIYETLGESLISLDKLSDLDKIMSIRDILYKNDIDIVHIDDNPETFDNVKLPLALIQLIYDNNRKWRVVETTHNIWFNGSMKNILPDAYAFCSRYHINNNFKNSKVPYKLIEYPIIDKSIESFASPFDENKINVLSVGLWTSGKNHGNTVEIARKMLEVNKNVHFHFVGNCAENFKEYWGDIIPNIPENCTVWGERSDVGVFYSNCDLFLFNSIWECNPIVLKEAISYGKKIILRNLPYYSGDYDLITHKLTDDLDNNINEILNAIDSLVPKYKYENIDDFSEKHLELYNEILKSEPIYNDFKKSIRVKISYIDGIKCEIVGNDNGYTYNVKFIDDDTNSLIFENNIEIDHWCKPLRQYFCKWRVEVTSDNPNFDKYVEVMDLENKTVCVRFDSSSLGDTIAWFPYVGEFAKKNNCKVHLKTFKNFLFNETELVKLVNFDQNYDYYAEYGIGVYDSEYKNPNKWNDIPLGQICTDILGIEYFEKRPFLNMDMYKKCTRKTNDRYVCIATNSTAQLKFWNNDTGWKDLTKWLKLNGWRVINLSQENNIIIDGVENLDDYSMENTISWLKYSDFFIGLSSGLSWLAWMLNIKVFSISGFIDSKCEFLDGMVKITNEKSCGNCWNRHNFDRGDWNWCPDHKGTQRQFECSKSITANMVIDKIKNNYEY